MMPVGARYEVPVQSTLNAVAAKIKDTEIEVVQISSRCPIHVCPRKTRRRCLDSPRDIGDELGEGIFRNGGWVIVGGLLGLASEGSSTFELYGKAMERRFPYFGFPFDRDPLHETSYELLLLHRRLGDSVATALRRWSFDADQVAEKQPHPYEGVRATLRYDPATQMATVPIVGLRRPVEDQVNLTAVLQDRFQMKRDATPAW
jgi:hypothetical protein